MVVRQVTVYEAGVEQTLAEKPAPAGAVDVDGRVAASGFQVGDDGGSTADAVEVVDVEGDSDLTRYREQVQDEVGRTSRRRAGGDAVLEGLAGQYAFRGEAALEQIHDQPSGAGADLVFAAVEGWGAC